MRCSLNEIGRLCERAALGAGLPDGSDIDAAALTAWLTGRDFHVLTGLLEELQHCRNRTKVDLTLELDPSEECHLDEKPGCAVASLLVEFMAARCFNGQAAARLNISGMRNPLYLLAATQFLPKDGFRFLACLYRDTPDGARLSILTAPGGVIQVWSDSASLVLAGDGVTSFQGQLWADRGDTQLVQSPERVPDLEDSELERRHARVLSEGVLVEKAWWETLKALGRRQLVPASDQSRQGAGAGLTDND